jgi:8-oxo-dGTP pyrophosphatase MutT (NUDIX family)
MVSPLAIDCVSRSWFGLYLVYLIPVCSWEQVESGETPEAALVRELQEELGIRVAAADLLPLTFASHTYKPSFHLLMPLYGAHPLLFELAVFHAALPCVADLLQACHHTPECWHTC